MDSGRHQEHSTYSASSSARWAGPTGCPASAILTKLMPPRPPSPESLGGTQAHELLELTLKGYQETLVGEYPQKAHDGVKYALDLVKYIVARSESYTMHVEQQLFWNVANWLPSEHSVYGYVDIVIHDPILQGLHIIDYKHGKRPVPVRNNWQLMQYACSALGYFPGVKHVTLYIVQPYAEASLPDAHPELEHVYSWSPSLAELANHEDMIRWSIERNMAYHITGDLNALEYHPSDANCRFCPAFMRCPKTQIVPKLPIFKMEFADIPAHEHGRLLHFLDYLAAYSKRMHEEILARARVGGVVDGWKLIKTGSNRRFFCKPEVEVAEKLHELGLDPDEIYERTLVSPPQAEERLKKTLRARKYKPAKIREKLEELAFFMDVPPKNILKLVPNDHPELAVKTEELLALSSVKMIEAPKIEN